MRIETQPDVFTTLLSEAERNLLFQGVSLWHLPRHGWSRHHFHRTTCQHHIKSLNDNLRALKFKHGAISTQSALAKNTLYACGSDNGRETSGQLQVRLETDQAESERDSELIEFSGD